MREGLSTERPYAEALRYLFGQPDMERGTAGPAPLGLEGIRALLEVLGQPDTRYPSILIAGTKGKGSTAAMIERALRAAGYRTGLYTQPHLHTMRERIRIDGAPISQDELVEVLMKVPRAAPSPQPSPRERGSLTTALSPQFSVLGPQFTAYEITTAMALQHFADQAVDVAVLEVGLGGRLDATNAVDAALAVLTSISLDHTQILGDTVEAIAREKADIIKPNRVCATVPQPSEAMAVIRAAAASRSARLIEVGQVGPHWDPRSDGGWDLLTARGRLSEVHLSLRGGFQRINAALAVAALEALDAEGIAAVPPGAVRVGLENTCWPGRFEIVGQIVIDGAHNVESAQRLNEALSEEFGDRPLRYVVGIATDKDISGILRALSSARVREVIATQSAHPRAASAYDIGATANLLGNLVSIASSVAEALDLAKEHSAEDELIVVTGSLHVVAEAREALGLAEPSDERAFDPWMIP
ncbi:MAG TPA: folylpolyglutamate synthase/dihydrofolate synthase family protein [Chloroflexota bacterium]